MQYFHGIINLQCDVSLVSSVFGGGCERGTKTSIRISSLPGRNRT